MKYLSPLVGFETLQKAFVKAKAVIEKEGKTPVFYTRALVEMEDFITQVCQVICYTPNNCMFKLLSSFGKIKKQKLNSLKLMLE